MNTTSHSSRREPVVTAGTLAVFLAVLSLMACESTGLQDTQAGPAAGRVAPSAAEQASRHTNSPIPPNPKNYWNQFRGPDGNGRSDATNLPVRFGETENLRWKTAIHGDGWSSPVVWGEQVWLTTASEDGSQLFVLSVDIASGRILHDIKVFDVEEPQLENPGLNSHATPTPIIEEGRIYVHFGAYGTACLDTKTGETLWERRDLQVDHRVRPASSPIVFGNKLFLTFDGVDAQFVTALDKRSGETLWVKERDVESDFAEKLREKGIKNVEAAVTKKPNDNRKSYATPTIIEVQGKAQLISPGAEVLFSYDPDTGKELWRYTLEGWSWNVACRPLFDHGLVYFTTGVSKRLVALKPSGSGDVTESHVAWSVKRGAPEIPSPIIVGDLLFMVTENGIVTAMQATSGEEVWKERLPGGGDYWASPIYADGKIYFTSKEGTVTVIAAGRQFELLTENELNATLIASPAVAGESLLFRSNRHLYRVSS